MSKISMEPADVSILKETPWHSLRSFITPSRDHYVVSALGIPHPSYDWSVRVGGAVRQPLEIPLEAIRKIPPRTLTVTMECAGDPLAPDKPVRRVSTARWRGAPLMAVLAQAQPHPESTHLWIDGADWGVYRRGSPTAEHVSEYRKDIPMQRAQKGDLLLAYEMNGEAISPDHGYPLRLIVPGYYGTNSVKWVNSILAANGRPGGLFASVLYNTIENVGGSIHRRQVAEVRVNSVLTSHRSGDVIAKGRHYLRGWAWGAWEVVSVKLRAGSEKRWFDARVGERLEGAWQPFEAEWFASKAGSYVISCRATDCRGNRQPDDEHINQISSTRVEVV